MAFKPELRSGGGDNILLCAGYLLPDVGESLGDRKLDKRNRAGGSLRRGCVGSCVLRLCTTANAELRRDHRDCALPSSPLPNDRSLSSRRARRAFGFRVGASAAAVAFFFSAARQWCESGDGRRRVWSTRAYASSNRVCVRPYVGNHCSRNSDQVKKLATAGYCLRVRDYGRGAVGFL